MANPRRDFLKNVFAFGALQGLVSSHATAAEFAELFDADNAQAINPDFDREAYDFWSGFLNNVADPVISATDKSRGKHPTGGNAQMPVFFHYGTEGFRNAAEIDTAGLIKEGDVSVSLNTSTIKIAPQDLETFRHVQNAQIRVDMAQKTSILPMIEAMAYTVVSGMLSVKAELQSKPKSTSPPKGGGKGPTSAPTASKSPSVSIQSISVPSDAAWQKMQNIILPGGEGRWALNLEAQKKDSLFYKVMQSIVREAGLFSPLIGLPCIGLSALQSFNNFYGAIHSQAVSIIKSNPLRVFATQEAIQKTGAPGAATGIMLKSGTYILIPANQAPNLDAMKDLTVIQGRIVPPKTKVGDVDAAAADTLKDVTYVTFDVEARPTRIFSDAVMRKSG